MLQNGHGRGNGSSRPLSAREECTGTTEIPSGDWSSVDKTADDFERAWKQGSQPAIEDYLAGVVEPRRSVLLKELLRVERELRIRAGEDPRPAEYHGRFPGDEPVIEAAFHRVAITSSTGGQDAGAEAGAVGGEPATGHFASTIQHSVLQALTETIGPSRPVLLRDTWPADGPSSMVLPSSPEMPALHEGPGRLQLFGEIARGGMGIVLKGRDPDLGRDLAVKVLLDNHRDNPELVLRFLEEAQIAGQLQHPGVVPVYELGQFADAARIFR